MTEWMRKILSKRENDLVKELKNKCPELTETQISFFRKLLPNLTDGLFIIKSDFYPGDPVLIGFGEEITHAIIKEIIVSEESVRYLVSWGTDEKECYTSEITTKDSV